MENGGGLLNCVTTPRSVVMLEKDGHTCGQLSGTFGDMVLHFRDRGEQVEVHSLHLREEVSLHGNNGPKDGI